MAPTEAVTLYGRVFLRGEIEVLTGLRIGGAAGGLEIGGVDNTVIRDPITGRPYLPGSSIRGKMRSLSEKLAGTVPNQPIGQGVSIHVPKTIEEYERTSIGPVFGVPGNLDYRHYPTRLIVRDVFLTDASVERLSRARTDLPFTEVKWEASIDRLTSAASPRQVERVPAGAVFGPLELIYSLYEAADLRRFRDVVVALQLLEDDYLGGLGSRGSGKVRFRDLTLFAKGRATYDRAEEQLERREHASLGELLARLDDTIAWLGRQAPVPAEA